MKTLRPFCYTLAWMAAVGLCAPTSSATEVGSPAQPTTTQPTNNATARFHDIGLAPGGLLIGQVLDDSLQPMPGAEVAIQSNGRTAATTTADANGVFAVAGLRGGVHQVVAGESVENCRLWAPGTAPPTAAPQLRFVPGHGNVVRGQWGPPKFGDPVKVWATNPWVIGGIVATAIAVPIVLHNLDDDDDSGS